MAMTFIDDFFAVEAVCQRPGLQLGCIQAETHGAALVGDVLLTLHEVDDRVGAGGVEFR